MRGVRPLACIATGVTICFGGILRDLLCQRPVAIGGQSYALATATGAAVYVGMRQLVVAGYAIPLVARIAAAMGTAAWPKRPSLQCSATARQATTGTSDCIRRLVEAAQADSQLSPRVTTQARR